MAKYGAKYLRWAPFAETTPEQVESAFPKYGDPISLGALVSAVGIAMMLQANVGLEPWSVLQEGMSNTMGITYGTASILVGAVIIAVSLLCGEPIGLGTVLNIVLCAVFIDGIQAMGWIPQMDTLWGGLLMLAAGLEILVIGTWLYMRTALGAGPRDSLMVALARKTGRSVGICRATVEIAVIAAGWLLGGQVGIGTVISAVGLGSLFNLNFKLLHFRASELRQESLLETLRNLRRPGRKAS